MKNILIGFISVFSFIVTVDACPYQKMAEIDSKLYLSSSKIDSKTLNEITVLKQKSQEKLKIGELDNAEEILDRALALLN